MQAPGGARSGTLDSFIERPIRTLFGALALVAFLALAPSAQATFPGANGKIAVPGLYTINPDGSGNVRITTAPSGYGDAFPSWSADGQKVVFERGYADIETQSFSVYLANADGSGVVSVPNTSSDYDSDPSLSPDGAKIVFRLGPDLYTINPDGSGLTFLVGHAATPTWSPDGQKIAYSAPAESSQSDVWVINADGSGATDVAQIGGYPSWSPDGTRIAFHSYFRSNAWQIWVMNADGSNQQSIETDGYFPAWSPDGRKIAYIKDTDPGPGANDKIATMNPDGSGRVLLNTTYRPRDPDWQPLPTTNYPHPQSAASLSASLVPTFRPCGTGANPTNGQHSPPLGTQACLPPVPGSNVARVGASSVGTASFAAVPGDTDPTNGDQANMTVSASLSDVKTTAGADYVPSPSGPDLTEITRLRLTDKANNYGGASGTATEYDFRVPLDCAATSDPSIGSICSTSTSADSLLPGFITEQRQTAVQAFRVRVDDAGANGTTGDSDDRIFATQGIYIP